MTYPDTISHWTDWGPVPRPDTPGLTGFPDGEDEEYDEDWGRGYD
jgi:hypothetical protein